MGQCSTTSQIMTERNQSSIIDEIYPIQIAVLPNKNQIVLQSSDGQIYPIDISISKQLPAFYRNLKLSSKVDDGYYISEDNRVIAVMGFESIKDRRTMQLLYLLAKSKKYTTFKIPKFQQNCLIIANQTYTPKVILQSKLKTITKEQTIKKHQDIYKQSQNKLVMVSKPLENVQKQCKFLNIVELSQHMRNRGIDWFDNQLEKIIKNVLFYLQQLHNEKLAGLKAILIGPGANIYLLAGYKELKQINQRQISRDYANLKEIVINCLVRQQAGIEQHRKHVYALQDNYPKTFQLLQNLQRSTPDTIKISFLQQIKSTFVNGYIQSYFSFHHPTDKLMLGYTLLQNFQMLQKIYTEQLQVIDFTNHYSVQALELYEKLLEIQQQKILESTYEETKLEYNVKPSDNKKRYLKQILEISEKLTQKYFISGEFNETLKLCERIIKNQLLSDNSSQNLYRLYQYRCRASRIVKRVQDSMEYCLQGMKLFPDHYQFVSQLIECFLIDWKQLAIKNILNMHLSLIETERLYYQSYLKLIMAVKSLNKPLILQSLKTLQSCIQKIPKEQIRQLVKCYILKGDILLYYKDAEKSYNIYKEAELLCRSENFDQKRLCSIVIKQGMGNCHFLSEKYQEAAKVYEQARQMCFPQQLEQKQILYTNEVLSRYLFTQGASKQLHNTQLSKLLTSMKTSDKHNINSRFIELQLLRNPS